MFLIKDQFEFSLLYFLKGDEERTFCMELYFGSACYEAV